MNQRPAERLRTVGAIPATIVAGWGVVAGTLALDDNSFFTHLATGRLILDEGAVPTTDPYSYTATGTDWLVQSWLASLLFAAAEELAGPTGIRVLLTALTVSISLLIWTLSRGAPSLIPRSATVVLVVLVSAGAVSERPLLFGLVGFLLVMLVGEGRLDPRWLLPVFWVWVNSHGSFPLGLLYLMAYFAGRWLDGEDRSEGRRPLLFAVGGIALGAVSPIGPRILVFPVELLRRNDLLSEVAEWQSPEFVSIPQRAALLVLALSIVALVRRPHYSRALPLALFTMAALLGSRNLGLLAFVCVLPLVDGFGDLGTIRSDQRSVIALPAAGLLAALALLVGVSRLQEADYHFGAYPVRALAFVEEQYGPPSGAPIVAREAVGNLQELIYGVEANVFTDDRFDMYPRILLEDTIELLGDPRDWEEILARHDAKIIIWQVDESLSLLLRESDDWQIAYTDELWMVSVRRSATT